MKRIVLAYPSDRDGAEAVAWLADKSSAEVVVLLFDFGQGRALEAKRDEALAAGAVRAHVLDVADAFANRFWLPALKAGALYHDGRGRTSGLGCALWAEKLVEVAAIEEAQAIAHGCGVKDSRLSTAARSLNSSLRVIAPPDRLGARAIREASRILTATLPPEAAFVDLTFVAGVPTAVNGIPMPLVDLIGTVDMIARAHGVGSYDDFETPATTVLHAAHESMSPASHAPSYADLIDRGLWFSPARLDLDAVVEEQQRSVDGTVRIRLLNGDCQIVESHLRSAPAVVSMAVAKG